MLLLLIQKIAGRFVIHLVARRNPYPRFAGCACRKRGNVCAERGWREGRDSLCRLVLNRRRYISGWSARKRGRRRRTPHTPHRLHRFALKSAKVIGHLKLFAAPHEGETLLYHLAVEQITVPGIDVS